MLCLLAGSSALSCSVYDSTLIDGGQAKPDGGSHGGAGMHAMGLDADIDAAADSGEDGTDASDAETGGASGTGGGAGGAGGAGSSAGTGGSAGGGGTLADAGPCMPGTGADCCPNDPKKTDPGVCGCGTPDSDADFDGLVDCGDPALGWEKAITFDGAQVDATLTAFPALVRITDSELAASAASDAADIYFLDQAHATLLVHEIERYDATSGALLAWVRVPELAAATDTVIYLRYGGGGTDRSDPTALWSDHYYVWHLAEDPGPGTAGGIRDSTGRAPGTAHSTMLSSDLVDAVIGKGIRFDGVDDEITFTNTFTGSGPSTLSAWVNQLVDNDGVSDTILAFGNGSANQTRLFYSAQTMTNNLVGGFYNNDKDSAVSIENAGWSHVAWVWDGTSSRFYVNGALASGPLAHTGANTTGTPGKIGNATWAARPLRGQLDEVRAESTTRSDAWIKAEYNNQRAGTFLKTLGPQQAVTPP